MTDCSIIDETTFESDNYYNCNYYVNNLNDCCWDGKTCNDGCYASARDVCPQCEYAECDGYCSTSNQID